jgi:hypothetical protein
MPAGVRGGNLIGERISDPSEFSHAFPKGHRLVSCSAVIIALALGACSVGQSSPSTTSGAAPGSPGPSGGAPGDSGSATAAGVVPFQQGAPSTTKQVGQIPSYTEGSGTIVSGTTADQATEAALAAYPGGVVDRVVQLSGGEYEVHNIGINWPHHVFVDQGFQVLGAN